MSLATRCPACGTVFRVVLDQLRISEGWVRCGRCNGVFDAAEVLFDIDQGTPVHLDLSQPAAAAQPPSEPTLPDSPRQDAETEAAPAPGDTVVLPAPAQDANDDPDEPWQVSDWTGPVPLAPAAHGPERIEPSFDDFDAGLAAKPQAHAPGLLRMASEDEASAHALPGNAAPMAPTHTGSAVSPAAVASPAVPAASFLTAADRAAWWRRPAVRTALMAGVGLLAATALVQAMLLGRDTLAVQAPATAPVLRALCSLLRCELHAPRRIDALTVDSSALGRVDGAGLYRLQLALRNHADIPVLAPALELSVTDSQGKLVSRRVLRLAELGVADTALAPGQAVTLQAVLAMGQQRIDGYTVELFYP